MGVALARIGVRVSHITPSVGVGMGEERVAHHFAHKEQTQQKGYVPNLFHAAKIRLHIGLCNTNKWLF